MSHFSVLVIGDDFEQQLAPFHEFECTGKNDQYVQDIDETAEKHEEFKAATQSMVRCPDGTLVDSHDDRFYREPTPEELKELGPLAFTGWSDGKYHRSKDWNDGQGYRPKIHEIPSDHEQVEVPFESFRAYLADYCEEKEVNKPVDMNLNLDGEHKYGYFIYDQDTDTVEKVIRRTNPNAKWDWYVVGGRWTGFLKLKPGAIGTSDQATKGAIDFDSMRNDAGLKAAQTWDKAALAKEQAGFDKNATWESWEAVCERTKDNMVARQEYHDQPVLKAVKQVFDNPFFEYSELLVSRDEYIEQARNKAVTPYALVMNGEWFAKGNMGWFGMSDDKISQASWNDDINSLLDSLSDDTQITIVDCHI